MIFLTLAAYAGWWAAMTARDRARRRREVVLPRARVTYLPSAYCRNGAPAPHWSERTLVESFSDPD